MNMEDESMQTGLHPVLQDDKQITLLVKRLILEKEAELHCLRRSLGQGSVIIACDMNTGAMLSSSVSSLELQPAAEEIKSRAASSTSEMVKASDMFSGATTNGGAPKRPFPYTADDERDGVDLPRRLMGRRGCLLFEVDLCKKLYGGIKYNHRIKSRSGQSKNVFAVLDHKQATISQCEEYLRLYYERGNELSPSILRYLNTASAVTTSDWLVPLSRTAPNPLSALYPLYFDPVNPSRTAKVVWNLKKEKADGVVSIKNDSEDKRKGQGAKDRGKQLKLAHA